MSFILSAQEYARLSSIEDAARNLYHVIDDLTKAPKGRKPLLRMVVRDNESETLINAAVVEMAVVLGLTEASPFRRPPVS